MMPTLTARTERELQLAEEVALILRDPGDMSTLEVRLRAAIVGELVETFTDAAAEMPHPPGVDLDLEEQALVWATAQAGELARQMARSVQEEVALAGVAGAAVAAADPDLRAAAVGVTEVTRATSVAEKAAAREYGRLSGETLLGTWNTETDPCPVCEPLDGQPEEVYERFFPDGPPAHPNCRCWLTWQLREAILLEDCGTGAGGFKSGNDCAAGGGSGRRKWWDSQGETGALQAAGCGGRAASRGEAEEEGVRQEQGTG